MAPSKKPKSVNKRLTSVKDVTPKKDGDATIKSGQRKRKLSDMLGHQWSKRELERFYEAYRKYGKDWKKVAVAIRNRSVEMVEALYTMNRAYLSLPEGTASVAGLVAMMTDHYSVLGGSDSEQESNEGTGTPRKSQKRARVKLPNSAANGSDSMIVDLLPFQSSAANLSLFKKRRSGTRPRAVGKRTPRFPVSYSYSKDKNERFLSPIRQDLKQKRDATDDDVAHEIALALTEASQKGGSPQVSRTPNRQRANTESEMTSSKHRGSEMDEDDFELSLGSTETDSGDYPRKSGYLIGTEGVDTVEVRCGGKKYNGQKLEVDDGVDNHLDDIKEACSGTEEGPELGTVKGKFEGEAKDSKSVRTSYRGPKKKSKKVLFGKDEASAFDALQTLADLSLMQTTTDTDSAVQTKGTKSETANKSDLNGNRSISVVKVTKLSASDSSDIPKGKETSNKTNTGTRKVRQKSSPFKVPKDETLTNSCLDLPQQVAAKDEAKFVSKTKRSHISANPKQGKSVKTPERSSSSTEHGKQWNDSVPSPVQAPSTNQANLPTKARSKRKTEVAKRLIDIDERPLENIVNSQSSVPSLKKKLSNSLSWILMRRWCAYEWFYSAIDYPWFARREFVEYLDHVGLSHIPRLTRVEWGVIRSSLGKPRRFSEQLLKEEKEKLNQYRESVRKHYSELRNGTREGLPTDLARPLSVAQRVIAIHPRTGEFHNGSILTVDHDRCRVQFVQPELGVEFVMDIDCMPLNPLENLPASLMRQNATFDRVFENFKELKMNGQLKDRQMKENVKLVPCEKLESSDGLSDRPTSTYPINAFVLENKDGSTASNSQNKAGSHDTVIVHQATNSRPFGAHIQAKETDAQALAELTHALDKKEGMVAELRCMNDEVQENQKDGDNSLKESESFKKQYAAVLFQLNEVNEQVSSALFCLRQRNTYKGNSSLVLSTANIANTGNFTDTLEHSTNHAQESGSHVAEIVESSRTKAQTLVGAAMLAVKTLKEDNGVEGIEEVIDFLSDRLSVDDFTIPATNSSTTPERAHNTLVSQVQKTGLASTPSAADAKSEKLPDQQTETQIPSELIERCVATLLMIQKCTERQFPPGEVAQVLDYAITSLQPCSLTNLPVYREIQKCMGIIRNQILALIPT